MTRIAEYLQVHRGPRTVLCYALYLAIAALALIDGLVIWRQTLFVLSFSLFANNDVARLAYVVGMVFLSFCLLIGILSSEPYLRDGMIRGHLLRRFFAIVLGLAAFGLAGVLIQLLSFA